MDADNVIQVSMVEEFDQNGVNIHCHTSEVEIVVPQGVNGVPADCTVLAGQDASSDILSKFNDVEIADPADQVVIEHSDIQTKNDDSPDIDEVEVKESDQAKNPKPQSNQSKNKSKKVSSTKHATMSMEKTSSGMETKATSNSALSAGIRLKHPVVKGISVNEKRSINNNLSKPMKPGLATSNSHKPKEKPAKSDSTSSDNLVDTEAPVDKPKLRPLRKGTVNETEEAESVSSPTSGDSRHLKVGKLPSYGFSFRCDERAEKRKEFYSKLEEKIHAKEVERTNQQAKSKETQEAELKMLRKSLNFKATPMPSFYQEPPPPKAELKKIPTTRPRSPKLGRKKTLSNTDTDQNGEGLHQSSRLSLDEKKAPHSKLSKGPSPIQSKRPQRKSLPRLPSEKTAFPNPTPDKDRNDPTNELDLIETKNPDELLGAQVDQTEPLADNGSVVEEHDLVQVEH